MVGCFQMSELFSNMTLSSRVVPAITVIAIYCIFAEIKPCNASDTFSTIETLTGDQDLNEEHTYNGFTELSPVANLSTIESTTNSSPEMKQYITITYNKFSNATNNSEDETSSSNLSPEMKLYETILADRFYNNVSSNNEDERLPSNFLPETSHNESIYFDKFSNNTTSNIDYERPSTNLSPEINHNETILMANFSYNTTNNSEDERSTSKLFENSFHINLQDVVSLKSTKSDNIGDHLLTVTPTIAEVNDQHSENMQMTKSVISFYRNPEINVSQLFTVITTQETSTEQFSPSLLEDSTKMSHSYFENHTPETVSDENVTLSLDINIKSNGNSSVGHNTTSKQLSSELEWNRIRCNYSTDCDTEQICAKSGTGESYCECILNSFRDNNTGACIGKPLFNRTIIPNLNMTDYTTMKSTSLTSIMINNQSSNADEREYVTNAINNSFPSVEPSLSVYKQENTTTAVPCLDIRNNTISFEEENNMSTSNNDRNFENNDTTVHNNKENLNKSVDETLQTANSLPVTTMSSVLDGNLSAVTTMISSHFPTKGKQGLNFQMRCRDNLTDLEESEFIISIQFNSMIQVTEWFHTYDFDFRACIISMLMKTNVSENKMNFSMGAQHVIYVVPTPITNEKEISVCFMVERDASGKEYVNAKDVLEVISKDQEAFNTKFPLNILSIQPGCLRKYKDSCLETIAQVKVGAYTAITFVLVAFAIVSYWLKKKYRRNYGRFKGRSTHPNWNGARYRSAGRNLSSDLQCTSQEVVNTTNNNEVDGNETIQENVQNHNVDVINSDDEHLEELPQVNIIHERRESERKQIQDIQL